MNVALHSAFGPVYLFVASFLFGITLYLVSAFLNSGSLVLSAIACNRFPTFKTFFDRIRSRKMSSGAMIASDYILCLLFASSILCVTFIFNSGNFRILTLVVMLIGFVTGRRILTRMINKIIILILFLIKWIINIALFPFIWVGKRIVKIVIKLLGRIKSRRNNKLIQKYTAFCFEKIEKDAEYGLIDDYYKELLK